MDIIAKLKETLAHIQNSKSKKDLQIAYILDFCLLEYHPSKAKSTKVRKEDISISSNIEAVRKRDDGRDQLAVFEDKKEDNNYK